MEQQVLGAVGKYEILRPIGEGGMAQVYLCVRRGAGGFEKRMVLKVLHSKFLGDQGYVTMFLEEARLLSRIQHPNIVTVFEVECVEGGPFQIPYLAMEYVNGPTLGRLHRKSIRSGLHDLSKMLYIVSQVCQGLHYAHTLRTDGLPAGLVHRDVSSQNILIDAKSGAVKLIDFGIAKADQGQSKTEVGVYKGKIQYMAPEILKGQRPDGRSDLYAVGVLLYRLVTDRSPIADGDDVWSARLSGRYPKVSEIAPEVSPGLEAIIDRALRPEPADRYQTALELATDLTREIDRMGGLDPSLLPGWIGRLFPGGEEEWSRRTGPAGANSTMHSTLNHLVTDLGTGATRVPPPPAPSRWSGVVGGTISSLMILGLASLIWTALPDRGEAPSPAPREEAAEPPAVAEAPPPDPEPAKAQVYVLRSEPAGAEVWSGNTRLGNTPLELVSLPEAPLRLRLTDHEDTPVDIDGLERDHESIVRMARSRPSRPPSRPPPRPKKEPPPVPVVAPSRPGVATER